MLLTDRDLAIAAAEAGAAVVRSSSCASLARFEKSPNDFATAADIEAEKAILDVLRTARPRDAVMGEESGHTGAAVANRTWLVDPLCGTPNYAAQTTLVAVNVRTADGHLIERNEVAAGTPLYALVKPSARYPGMRRCSEAARIGAAHDGRVCG